MKFLIKWLDKNTYMDNFQFYETIVEGSDKEKTILTLYQNNNKAICASAELIKNSG